MSVDIFETCDDYYCVSLPKSEWTKTDRWFGTNVSLTSMVLTEWNKIQKTVELGPKEALHLGVAPIDAMTNGISPGEIMYIGHVDEKTNTAFSLNIVNSFGIDAKRKLLVFNAGKGEYAYARGIISLRAEVDEFDLKSCNPLHSHQKENIEKAVSDIQLSDISVINTPYICVESIYDEVFKLADADRPELILIDNLYFITTKEKCKSKNQEYRIVAGKLWKLAKDIRIPIIVTGPLSKKRRSMKDYWPTAFDMPAENMLGSFDKILMVHKNNKNSGILNVSIVKNRDGSYGYRKVKHISATNKLEEIRR